MSTALVVGLAETGCAVARRLRAEGWDVVVTEDRPGGDSYAARAASVARLGATIVEAPSGERYARLVEGAAVVVPSPLVRPTHPVIGAARAAGVPVRSEIDLAGERARVPIVAVTGTNGKTTVTTVAAAMLVASGRRALAAGNIGRPLIDAVADECDVLVAEVSSFQLAFAETFRPRVAVLLGIAEDHLDWHGDFAHYVASKARVFEHQRDGDLLVFDGDDEIAARTAQAAPARRVAVTTRAPVAYADAFHLDGGALRTPDGRVIAQLGELRRALAHDVTNALAAAAAVLEVGATADGVRDALRSHTTLPHRVAFVGEHGGVQYYDDSKATNPHATLHAVASFESVVLLAGGRNKGLDLRALRAAAGNVRHVVAFGEAAREVATAFEGLRPVVTVRTMREAVRAAASTARPGDVVLLSPACASFDAYPSYAARGDDFAAEVRALQTGVGGTRVP